MRRQARAMAAAPLAVALAISGVGVASAQDAIEPGSVELEFLVFETPNLPAEFWDDAINRTVEEFPQFKINKIVAPDLNIGDFLKQLLATGQFPDVAMSNFPTAEFIDAGALLPFEDSDLERFIDPVGLGLTDGRKYDLPQLTVLESVVFYNQDMFDAAGIIEEPSTYQEFLDAAQALADSGFTPIVAGGAGEDRWAAAWPLLNLVALNVTGVDADYLKNLKTGETSFNDPLFVEAAAAYADWVERGWVTSDALSLNYAQLQESFLGGSGAMYPMGSFAAGAVPIDHPFAVGVFPMPTFDGANRLVTYTSGGPTVSATTENPEQARLFAVEFATNIATNADDLRRDAHVPNNKDFDLERDTAGMELHPLIGEVIEILAQEDAQAVSFFTYEVGDDALLPGFQTEVQVISQEILGGSSAEEVSASLQDSWDELGG
jgi:ABC-type glycerol-3-phosphate transport system substrate-binding protein